MVVAFSNGWDHEIMDEMLMEIDGQKAEVGVSSHKETPLRSFSRLDVSGMPLLIPSSIEKFFLFFVSFFIATISVKIPSFLKKI